jgi:hypothetical protein
MKSFNVINYNFNAQKFEAYDVIPYLVNAYKNRVKRYHELEKEYKNNPDAENDPFITTLETFKVPKTFDEFKEFVEDESQYQFWSRCEYEIILSPWPYVLSPSEGYDKSKENDIDAWKEHWKKHLDSCDKWDVYDQIMMNLDIVTKLLMESI